jgi:hypothetical protein
MIVHVRSATFLAKDRQKDGKEEQVRDYGKEEHFPGGAPSQASTITPSARTFTFLLCGEH